MTSFDIKSDETEADIEVQGGNTRARMKAILDAITPEMNGEVNYMRVQIRTDAEGETAEGLPSTTTGSEPDEGGSPPAVDTESGPQREVGGGGRVGKMEEVPERSPRTDEGSRERLTEADREAGTMRENSSHHVVASLLHEHGRTRPAELQAMLDEMPEGTLSGALQQLWIRKLADRTDQEIDPEDGGSVTKYWLTDRGEDHIEEMGTTTEEEWA